MQQCRRCLLNIGVQPRSSLYLHPASSGLCYVQHLSVYASIQKPVVHERAMQVLLGPVSPDLHGNTPAATCSTGRVRGTAWRARIPSKTPLTCKQISSTQINKYFWHQKKKKKKEIHLT